MSSYLYMKQMKKCPKCQIRALMSRDSISMKRLDDERGLPKSAEWYGLEEKYASEGTMIMDGLDNWEAEKLQSAVQKAIIDLM